MGKTSDSKQFHFTLSDARRSITLSKNLLTSPSPLQTAPQAGAQVTAIVIIYERDSLSLLSDARKAHP